MSASSSAPSGSWPSHDPQCQWGIWLMAQELFSLQQEHKPLTFDHSTGEAVSYFYAVLLEKIGALTPSRQAGGDQGRARWSIRVGKSCHLQRCAGVLQGMQEEHPTTVDLRGPVWRLSESCQEPEGFSGGRGCW